MIARPTLYLDRGGDTVQVDNTAAQLRILGVDVDINTELMPLVYDKYDLVHFFNIIDCEDIIGHVLRMNVPYVVSTIYVDYREFDSKFRKGAVGLISKLFSYNQVEYFKTLAKFILKGERVSTYKYFLLGHSKCIKIILQGSSCLLPNSENEYKRLYDDYKVEKKHLVIPNGVNLNLFAEAPVDYKREIVLCVARIEGRKNQLNLIKALAGTNINLVLIGAVSPNQKRYYELCKQHAGTNVKFIPQISQAQLLEYYAKAKVHVLPSWFETTGLTSLEAAVMGCNIVVAGRGDVRDYFNDFAYYCEPDNIPSIKNAILKALEAPYDEEFGSLIKDKYNWERAAIETLKAYKFALSSVQRNVLYLDNN
jgi:glycosyltransferase involved in cell wall biosynthesis